MEDCEWSGDSQTLQVDRIASSVSVNHEFDGESNLIPELKTGRNQDNRTQRLNTFGGFGNDADSFEGSFYLDLYDTATWPRPQDSWRFFKIPESGSKVKAAEGWTMYIDRIHNADMDNYPHEVYFPIYWSIFDTSKKPQEKDAILRAPKTYIALTDEVDRGFNPKTPFRIRIKMDMLFDTRYNPFTGAEEPGQSSYHSDLKYASFVYLFCSLELKADSGKTYYWTNQQSRFLRADGLRDYNAFLNFGSGVWSESPSIRGI